MSQFLEKIAQAKALGNDWVETTPQIIKLLQPRGLGTVHGRPVRHFSYQGILVCEQGQLESVQDEMNRSLNDEKHGSNEAKVISGA